MDRAVAVSSKAAILLLSIAAGIFYPWYLLILIFGFILTRLYYKMRFNMNYPSLA